MSTITAASTEVLIDIALADLGIGEQEHDDKRILRELGVLRPALLAVEEDAAVDSVVVRHSHVEHSTFHKSRPCEFLIDFCQGVAESSGELLVDGLHEDDGRLDQALLNDSVDRFCYERLPVIVAVLDTLVGGNNSAGADLNLRGDVLDVTLHLEALVQERLVVGIEGGAEEVLLLALDLSGETENHVLVSLPREVDIGVVYDSVGFVHDDNSVLGDLLAFRKLTGQDELDVVVGAHVLFHVQLVLAEHLFVDHHDGHGVSLIRMEAGEEEADKSLAVTSIHLDGDGAPLVEEHLGDHEVLVGLERVIGVADGPELIAHGVHLLHGCLEALLVNHHGGLLGDLCLVDGVALPTATLLTELLEGIQDAVTEVLFGLLGIHVLQEGEQLDHIVGGDVLSLEHVRHAKHILQLGVVVGKVLALLEEGG